MSNSSNNVQILIFESKGKQSKQSFGLNIFKVQEIISCPKVTNLANSDPAILGLIKSRDELIPLVDLSMVLFGTHTEEKKEQIVIICHGSGRKIALLVDNVSDITDTNWEDVKTAEGIAAESSYITGFITVNDELISILNLEEVMIQYLGIENRETTAQSNKAKNKNVLVIDDSKWVHKVVDAEFKKQQINHFEALNAKIALEKLQQESTEYDIILCDIEMPVMNGYSFLQEVQNLKAQGKKFPPIVMYSSLCDDVSIAKAKELGAAHYITKYNMDKIVRTIEEFAA
jgi:two-component system chemotaxis response regulator CheV